MEYINMEQLQKEGWRLVRYYTEDGMAVVQNMELKSVPKDLLINVIKCKECAFYMKDPELARAAGLLPEFYCAVHRIEMGRDAFCSYGRKDPWIK